MVRKLTAFCLALCFIFTMSVTTFANEFDADKTGSISIKLVGQDGNKPVSGAELSVYYVATVVLNEKGNLSYAYTEEFKNCKTALNDQALAVALETFVKENSVPAEKFVTGSDGKAVIKNLPLGLYFVMQTNSKDFSATCLPFLVTVPSKISDEFVYDVNASPKTDVTKLVDVTIKKVWNIDETVKAPKRVTIELHKNGVKVESVVLNEDNNWRATISDLPASDSYSVVEVNVPEGFVATYIGSGYDFTVINSAHLVQTGQLVWPIPALAMAGLILIGTGTVVLIKQRNKDE